ncbi:PEGA domain-containing protein, partial [Myxococcota bacterium]|nr:PEGA domain-containing protein [Myxococcota bacterium]
MFLLFAIFFALASPATEAARLVDEADALLRGGDPLAALAALNAAYQLDPDPRYIANQGLVLEQLGQYARAVERFERYLSLTTAPEKRELASLNIERLKPKILFTSDPPGASIFVDGAKAAVGLTPCHVAILVGAHYAELRKPGFKPARATFEVHKGAPGVVEARLEPKAKPADQPPPLTAPPTAAPRWGALGLSAAAALTSAALLYQMNQEVRARDEAGRLAVWDEHD